MSDDESGRLFCVPRSGFSDNIFSLMPLRVSTDHSKMMQLRAVRTLTGYTNAQPISVLAVCVSPIPTCHPSYFFKLVHVTKLCARAVREYHVCLECYPSKIY